jgi:hypothetical protein
MTKYWPHGLELCDAQTPLEILRDAQTEWKSSSGGVLELILQKAESTAGYHIIVVHAEHVASNRTASLFSVVSRKTHPYPARLQPKDEELPNFFKKSYKTRNFNALSSIPALLNQSKEEWIENEWVADTPSEFRVKLQDVFNLGNIKSIILNLLSSDDAHSDIGSGTYENVENSAKPESPLSDEETESL